MKTFIGGLIALVLGLIGIVVWFPDFLDLLAGAIPVILLLGGALAFYLGLDELKDSWKKEETSEPAPVTEDVDKYKQEIDDLKKEIDGLKSEKA